MTGRNDGTRTWSLSWTLENRLKQATSDSDSVTFVYDGDGNMVLRIQNGQATVYLGKLYQHNHSSGVQTMRTFFNGRQVVQRDAGLSQPVFILSDHLGSATTTLNAGGSKTADLRYDPWGNARRPGVSTPAAAG